MAGKSPLLGDDVGLPALHDVALLTLLYMTMTGWLQAFAVVGTGGVSAMEFLPYATSWFDNVVAADDPSVIAREVDQREYPDSIPSSLGLNAAALRLLRQVQTTSAWTARSSMRSASSRTDGWPMATAPTDTRA